jgi:DNA topoisomerase-3
MAPDPGQGTAQGEAAITALTAAGAVVEIPLPETTGREVTRSTRRRQRSVQGSPGGKRPAGRNNERAGRDRVGICPLCEADVREQKQSFTCSRWQEGCPCVIWKSISGKKIGVRIARLLLRKGETGVLRGFKSKAGKPFSARLRLENGQVKFDFGK